MNEITSFHGFSGSDGAAPHSVEAEQQILGAMLTNNAAIDILAPMLKTEHFFDPVHAHIYKLAVDRHSKGHLVSPVTMKALLEFYEPLNDLGGFRYLVRLAGAAISSFAVLDYARLVIEKAACRALQEAFAEGHRSLFAGGESQTVKHALLQALHALPEAMGGESSYSMLRSVVDAVTRANEAYQGRSAFLKTGIGPLDKVLKGLGPTDYMLIGGATSMGKTSLALEIATNVAVNQDKGVVFVSLEMTREELVTRMASAKARVPYSLLRDAAEMEEADFRKWVEAGQSIASAPMRIVPRHIRDLAAIQAACKKASHELDGKPISLLVVDYLQLVRGPGKDRFEQMTNTSIGAKHLAGVLGCPVIGLVQLSREIGKRDDKRPQLSDIKETGQFENDADQVVLCHREDYWMQREGAKPGRDGTVSVSAQADFEAELVRARNKMQLIVRKNRHGPLATAEVGFHDATNRFWSLGDREVTQGDF
ncbi:MAG: DnaB-like helicase C-terminal domain-containing protein [Paracoccaceae bacterium]